MATELGVSGLKRYGGYIFEEFLPALQGAKAIQVYKQMSENDPVVGAFLFTVDMLMRKATARVEPFSQSTEDVKNAKFVEDCIDDLNPNWSSTLSEMLSMLQYGWSWLEICYKKRNGATRDPDTSSRFTDGKTGWSKFAIRSQDSWLEWRFKQSGRVEAMVQLAPPDFQTIVLPRQKALHLVTRSRKMNPEGVSILRTAYRPWFFKTRMEEVEGIGIERDLAGLPVAFLPSSFLLDSATDDEKSMVLSIRNMVTQVRRDQTEGVLFPQDYDANGKPLFDFKLMSTGGARQFNTNETITRYDQRIAMTVLADFILLGTQNVGSWALSSDKTNLFSNAIGTWLKVIADEMNTQAIPELFYINNLPMDKMPTFAFGDIESPDLSEIADYIQKLSGASFPLFPNPELEDHLFEIAGFPEITEDVRQLQEERQQQEQEQQLAMFDQQTKIQAQHAQPKQAPGATGPGKPPQKAPGGLPARPGMGGSQPPVKKPTAPPTANGSKK